MKYQLTCPKCKYEFSYDNGYLDDNITRLGIEILSIPLLTDLHFPKKYQFKGCNDTQNRPLQIHFQCL